MVRREPGLWVYHTGEGRPKAFVPREGIKAGEEHLENNDEVSYEAFQGTEGPEPRNVSRT